MADERDLPEERMAFDHALDTFISFMEGLGFDPVDDIKDVLHDNLKGRDMDTDWIGD